MILVIPSTHPAPNKEKQFSLFSPVLKILAPKYFIIENSDLKNPKLPRRERGCGGVEEKRELFKWWSSIHYYYLEAVAINKAWLLFELICSEHLKILDWPIFQMIPLLQMESKLPMCKYFYWGGVVKIIWFLKSSLEARIISKFYLYSKLCVSFSTVNKKECALGNGTLLLS